MTVKTITIGPLSKQTGCNIETIRYYERIGLLADPPRSSGGHRLYERDHSQRLTFVQRSRELGFTLDQIRQLLTHIDGASFTCEQARSIALTHLDEVRAKIAELSRMERQLTELADQCSGAEIPECPVVKALFDEKSF